MLSKEAVHKPEPTDLFIENSLGAFARAISDKMDCAVRQAMNLSTSACYAIVQVGSERDSSIETLRKMLALEHSSLVRLLDRLEKRGLLERLRGVGEDMRQVKVRLTDLGEDCFTNILLARRKVLHNALSLLDREEKRLLLSLVNKMTPAAVDPGDDQHYVCRLCDLENCPQEICPVNLAHPDFFELPNEPFKRTAPTLTRPN